MESKELIFPQDNRLSYMGRLYWNEQNVPTFVFPYSMVRFRFWGNMLKVCVENMHSYYINHIGVMVDGVYMGKLFLKNQGDTILDISGFLMEGEHEVTLFKTQDACHYFVLKYLEIGLGDKLSKAKPFPERRIEVYGDSVSAGEVSEAIERTAGLDPENHEGIYSNSYYSYSAILSRLLQAQLHDIAQGGIALFTGTGYFSMPDTIGMEAVYDKITYNPSLGQVTSWDFQKYVPQVVIVAIGQNDNHPDDFFASGLNGEKADRWKQRYRWLIENLMTKYPDAHFILTTTILNHHKNWDKAIAEVVAEMQEKRVHHFMYEKTGEGTPGHIRIGEAFAMAEELNCFINTLDIHW